MQFLLFLIYFFIIEKYLHNSLYFIYYDAFVLEIWKKEKEKKKRGKKDLIEEFDDAVIGSINKINN